jgi:hypothetical protein
MGAKRLKKRNRYYRQDCAPRTVAYVGYDTNREALESARIHALEEWKMTQKALKAASLSEDFPLSQNPNKADQWKE